MKTQKSALSGRGGSNIARTKPVELLPVCSQVRLISILPLSAPFELKVLAGKQSF